MAAREKGRAQTQAGIDVFDPQWFREVENNAEFRRLLEQMNAGIMELDEDNRIVYVTPNVESTLGHSPEPPPDPYTRELGGDHLATSPLQGSRPRGSLRALDVLGLGYCSVGMRIATTLVLDTEPLTLADAGVAFDRIRSGDISINSLDAYKPL